MLCLLFTESNFEILSEKKLQVQLRVLTKAVYVSICSRVENLFEDTSVFHFFSRKTVTLFEDIFPFFRIKD